MSSASAGKVGTARAQPCNADTRKARGVHLLRRRTRRLTEPLGILPPSAADLWPRRTDVAVPLGIAPGRPQPLSLCHPDWPTRTGLTCSARVKRETRLALQHNASRVGVAPYTTKLWLAPSVVSGNPSDGGNTEFLQFLTWFFPLSRLNFAILAQDLVPELKFEFSSSPPRCRPRGPMVSAWQLL